MSKEQQSEDTRREVKPKEIEVTTVDALDAAKPTLEKKKRAPRMTNLSGIPVETNETSISAGPRGPLLMQDYVLFEKLAQFNRERIPERVVHAVGAGAYGTFTVTHDITKYTRAKIFSRVGKKTEMFARFSTVARSKGGPDCYRDVRGFALKFYTEEGNWDLAGNNTPVFFLRDPIKFPDFIRSQKRHPMQNWRQDAMWWDFWSHTPESLHQVLILMGDRGLPDGFRHMNGYGSHTYSLINEDNERVWVKFHFKPEQGVQNLTQEQSDMLLAKEPSYSTKDLFCAIDDGDFPRWTMFIQVMTDEEAAEFPYNPFDLTKVWPHGDFPLIEVGTMELNRNPDNYFAHVEQAAFSPGNMVPGISWSPDKMLQARIFSYADAHRYRLGTNYELLPVNRAHAPVHANARDGFMRFDDNSGGQINYKATREMHPEPDPSVAPPPMPVGGDGARYAQLEEDHYAQPRALYEIFSQGEKDRLLETVSGSLCMAHEEVQALQVEIFTKMHEGFGKKLSQALEEKAREMKQKKDDDKKKS